MSARLSSPAPGKAGVLRASAILLIAALLILAPGCRKDLDKVPKDKDKSLTPAQLYDKGMTLLKRGRYYRARQVLEKVLGRPNTGLDLLANANLAIADAYYYDGGVINVAEGLSRYTSFLTFYPSHPRADYAQYQLGLCYLKQALGPDKDQATTRQALDALRKVEIDHPDSDFAIAAREKANLCRERLAESETRIALFYMKRESWAGATDRFREVLALYSRYSKRDKVYFFLAEALRNSDKNVEAQIYYQKVLDEFPKSRYAGGARSALAEGQESEGRRAEAPEGKKSSAVRQTGGAAPVKGG